MGYAFLPDPSGKAIPEIIETSEGTTSWRDCKKALRQWYLDEAAKLRSVSEKDYFKDA